MHAVASNSCSGEIMISIDNPKSLRWTGLVALLFLCCQCEGGESDLPKIAFDAFVSNNTQRVSEFLMDESRYRTLTKGKEVGMTTTEYEKHIKDASRRARDSAHKSFRDIRRLLVASGFDWTSAKLERVETIVREGMDTKRVEFNPKSTEPRLDIHLIISSGEKTIELKLDDCFYVHGARYLGDGFKLRGSSGFELNETVLAEISGEEE
jgi:hypothetical protein